MLTSAGNREKARATGELCVVHKSNDPNFQRRQSNRNDERRRSLGQDSAIDNPIFAENSLSGDDARQRAISPQSPARELATGSSPENRTTARGRVPCHARQLFLPFPVFLLRTGKANQSSATTTALLPATLISRPTSASGLRIPRISR